MYGVIGGNKPRANARYGGATGARAFTAAIEAARMPTNMVIQVATVATIKPYFAIRRAAAWAKLLDTSAPIPANKGANKAGAGIILAFL